MRVLAALSGGVDSAVAAAFAVEAGHDVTGVHMALSQSPQSCRMGARGCCSLEDSEDAALAAQALGIPFYVWDLSEEFEDRVISDFLSQYRVGHTPNPCVRCNEFVKFKELAERAKALGFDAVCTGHYARKIDRYGTPELHRAFDSAKDQSYVLAVMGTAELERVLLPLGEAPSKQWVRQQAQQRGLGVSAKPDSYDICFIPDGDTAGFLRRNLGEQPGLIVDQDGATVGEHLGSYQFTVGQRKGLRLERPAPDGKPRYVLATEPRTNRVIVGAAELLSVDQLSGAGPVLYVDRSRFEVDQSIVDDFGTSLGGRNLHEVPENLLTVQIRAHGVPSVVKSVEFGEGTLTVALAEPIRGVAAGQSMVIYRGSRVVAEATITAGTRGSISTLESIPGSLVS